MRDPRVTFFLAGHQPATFLHPPVTIPPVVRRCFGDSASDIQDCLRRSYPCLLWRPTLPALHNAQGAAQKIESSLFLPLWGEHEPPLAPPLLYYGASSSRN